MDSNGKAKIIGSEFNSKNKSYELDIGEVGCNQNAADVCPVQCIYVKP